MVRPEGVLKVDHHRRFHSCAIGCAQRHQAGHDCCDRDDELPCTPRVHPPAHLYHRYLGARTLTSGSSIRTIAMSTTARVPANRTLAGVSTSEWASVQECPFSNAWHMPHADRPGFFSVGDGPIMRSCLHSSSSQHRGCSVLSWARSSVGAGGGSSLSSCSASSSGSACCCRPILWHRRTTVSRTAAPTARSTSVTCWWEPNFVLVLAVLGNAAYLVGVGIGAAVGAILRAARKPRPTV